MRGVTAFIVYRSGNDHWISRFLHKDIKHCFVCFISRGYWVSVDYTLNGIIVDVSKSIPDGVYYQQVEVDNLRLLPVFPTCVGMVKHIIGVKNPFILTPWQLLKRVEHGKQGKKT